jgi:hypothetical protein
MFGTGRTSLRRFVWEQTYNLAIDLCILIVYIYVYIYKCGGVKQISKCGGVKQISKCGGVKQISKCGGVKQVLQADFFISSGRLQ